LDMGQFDASTGVFIYILLMMTTMVFFLGLHLALGTMY
jgi:hypothetical protein